MVHRISKRIREAIYGRKPYIIPDWLRSPWHGCGTVRKIVDHERECWRRIRRDRAIARVVAWALGLVAVVASIYFAMRAW